MSISVQHREYDDEEQRAEDAARLRASLDSQLEHAEKGRGADALASFFIDEIVSLRSQLRHLETRLGSAETVVDTHRIIG